MKGSEGAWEAVERLYRENGEGMRQLAAIESEERDWRHYVTLISLEIQDTIPQGCDIDLLNAVKLLVRENSALRCALGLPSYHEMATLEEEERYGEAC
jgi:hypothetical protein